MSVKLLIAEWDALRHYVSREFYFIIRILVEEHGWQYINVHELNNDPRPLEAKLLHRFGEMPETILFWDIHFFMAACAADIQGLSCHKCFFEDDLHTTGHTTIDRKRLSYVMCDVILATYAYNFHHLHPDLVNGRRIEWIPHAASSDFMLDFNVQPKNQIFLSGWINQFYPLRQKMRLLCEDQKYPIIYQRHPGYHARYEYSSNLHVGPAYAKTMHQYKVAFTDCLVYQYVVAKYFEIPATGALLLADEGVSEPLRELGFVDGEHYIGVSDNTLEDNIRYVLDPRYDADINAIRKRGQELVWARHTVRDRARRINDICTGR